MKLLRRNETFTKDKKIVNFTAFYLDCGNGVVVKVKPIYKSDYNTLKVLASEYEDK